MKEVPKHLNGIYYSPIIESQLSEIYFIPRHLIRYILCKYNCDNDQLLRIEDDINSIEGKLATLVKQNVYLMRAKQNRDAILVDYVYAKAVNGRNEYLAICESIKERIYVDYEIIKAIELIFEEPVLAEFSLGVKYDVFFRPYYVIVNIIPMQYIQFSSNELNKVRVCYSMQAWMNYIITSLGMNAKTMDMKRKMDALLALFPFVVDGCFILCICNSESDDLLGLWSYRGIATIDLDEKRKKQSGEVYQKVYRYVDRGGKINAAKGMALSNVLGYGIITNRKELIRTTCSAYWELTVADTLPFIMEASKRKYLPEYLKEGKILDKFCTYIISNEFDDYIDETSWRLNIDWLIRNIQELDVRPTMQMIKKRFKFQQRGSECSLDIEHIIRMSAVFCTLLYSEVSIISSDELHDILKYSINKQRDMNMNLRCKEESIITCYDLIMKEEETFTI